MAYQVNTLLQNRERFSRFFCAEVDRDVATDRNNDDHELWSSVRQHFIEVAKITGADHPAQDRLVAQVVFAREQGTLTRVITLKEASDGVDAGQAQSHENKTETAVTEKGKIWSDLPFLVEDLRDAWKTSLRTRQMSVQARCNLAAFTARLIAHGVCDLQLTICALWTLRDALETSRPLTTTSPVLPPSNVPGSAAGAEQENDGGDEVSIADLLPACRAFIEYSYFKLMALSMRTQTILEQPDLNVADLGDLARDVVADISSGLSMEGAGLSMARWHFWKRRLQQLGQELGAISGYEDVAKDASRAFNIMRLWEDQIT